MDNENRERWTDAVVGLVLALGALTVYLVTLSRGVYPGGPARLIAEATGLMPRMTPGHPIWNLFASLLQRIPVGNTVARLNVFSALCGAAAVWFVYRVVTETVFTSIRVTRKNRSRSLGAARLAGVSAVLFMAFCPPFWMAANRAGAATLDVLLLAMLTWFLVRAYQSLRIWPGMLLMSLYVVCSVEFAALVVLFPLFAGCIVYSLWLKERLTPATLMLHVAWAAAGLGVYFIVAWSFWGTQGYELRGFENYWQILWQMLLGHYRVIMYSLPRVGWLIILVLTIVPWVASLLVIRKALNEEKDWSYYLLHTVMTACALMVLLRVKVVTWPVNLVVPYVLTATLFGYLMAYWFLLPSVWWATDERRAVIWVRRWLGLLFVIPCFGTAGVVGVLNLQTADGRPVASISRYVDEVLDSLDGRRWLVTDGSFDSLLTIAARERGMDVRFLNLARGGNPVYQRLIAPLFDSAERRNQLSIGLYAMLQEWMASDPQVGAEMAVLSSPDLWIGAGYTVVPNKLVFLGTRDAAALDLDSLRADHERFWREGTLTRVREDFKDVPRIDRLSAYLVRHASRVANNLGVLLEDREQVDAAFAAYTMSRSICDENISALLNLAAMLDRHYKTQDEAEIRARVQQLVADQKTYRVWALARAYGYVRHPQAFVRLGMDWAASGRPGLAISGLKRALEMASGTAQIKVEQVLADAYFAEQDDKESERLYREVLAKAPDDRRALLGLGRIAVRRGAFEEAVGLFAKAEKAGAPRTTVAQEEAAMHLAAGKLDRARIILEELVELEPDSVRSWGMLATVRLQQEDETAYNECLRRMRLLRGGRGMVALLEAERAWQAHDFQSARHHYAEALRSRPNQPAILERLLRLDVIQGSEHSAENHARQLLGMSPDNAFAYYVIGSVQLRRDDLVLAEVSLRKSLELRRSTEALNDLAWLLTEKGEYEEAERLTREVIAGMPKLAHAWDTLGVIQMRRNELDEARRTFERSIELAPNLMSVYLHLAECKVLRGEKKRAIELIKMLVKNRGQLSMEEQDKMEEIGREVGYMPPR